MSTSRRYQSSLRDEQAHRTRQRIRASARTLFGEQGFGATTVAQIAKQAGVATPTVYAAYDSKAGIILAMLDDLQESVDVGARVGAAMAEPDARKQLRMWLAAHVELFAAGADILRAAQQAGDAPEVRALAERGDGARRSVIKALVGGWARDGMMREGLTAPEAIDRLWLLTTVEGFLNATDRLGWTVRRYEDWISHLAETEVFGAR